MKLGIDSYCYHRQFGDWYAGLQTDPGYRMSIPDFLRRATEYGVEGVSLEACYIPDTSAAAIARIRDELATRALDVVWAWGHPDGLGSGKLLEAVEDLERHLECARQVGAKVMRICAGGRRTRPTSWAEHKAGLIPLLRRAVATAEREGVVMAVENHIDLLADEMVELITTVDSPYLGVCLDTANNLRMFEDPVAVARKLAPYTRATHVKDISARRGDPNTFAFWPSVALGDGLVDIPEVLKLLRQAGYKGLLALEIDYLHPACGDDEDKVIVESLAYLRSLLECRRLP